jgi:hypothetical protein
MHKKGNFGRAKAGLAQVHIKARQRVCETLAQLLFGRDDKNLNQLD